MQIVGTNNPNIADINSLMSYTLMFVSRLNENLLVRLCVRDIADIVDTSG